MQLILGEINAQYLEDIMTRSVSFTDEVWAAVAYATDVRLFEWCKANEIPLRFWGRFDEGTPVRPEILRWFLNTRSPNYVCKLVAHFHPKVIWWRGFGAYIGSANLTDAAWFRNIESGCFIPEEEIVDGLDTDIENLFAEIEERSFALTDELANAIERRWRAAAKAREEEHGSFNDLQKHPHVKLWGGLTNVTKAAAADRAKGRFLQEWSGTLELLRMIAARISKDENRPSWIRADIPANAQADQFLHAYYEQCVVNKGLRYQSEFELNRLRREEALIEAISWWRSLNTAPTSERRMLEDWAPFLREHLAEGRVSRLTGAELEEVFQRVHSIRERARRVPNRQVNLPDGQAYTMQAKIAALASTVHTARSQSGRSVQQTLQRVLYGGAGTELPSRIWEATQNSSWKIPNLGVSALGELAGWALPNDYPPRNGRTNKALRALGNDVHVYSE